MSRAESSLGLLDRAGDALADRGAGEPVVIVAQSFVAELGLDPAAFDEWVRLKARVTMGAAADALGEDDPRVRGVARASYTGGFTEGFMYGVEFMRAHMARLGSQQ